MRNSYIAGNWKMHKTVADAVSLAKLLAQALSEEDKKILIAPPFTALYAVHRAIRNTNLLLGAQNMAIEESGAHTGEISPIMLKEVGVACVILGHSERRHVYGESNALIHKKVILAVKNSLDVILCVGETLQERERGITERVVEDQLRNGIQSMPEEDFKHITIAYEPVWAIGTGKNATPKDAEAIHQIIREWLRKQYNSDISETTIIQYGGSVKPNNVRDLMSMPNIDGALVGGASLTADEFIPIVQFDK